ncbi:hypothetical protein CONPUDRAFT_165561 [Coniophora puteana RWD-64-598 SS2]|uniref:Uncharacterized protein n=1 Tax=Coniophora puteana (strain RWD-64-598) TaxID=741705 RepID=A0A5M3MQR4_CONPW|nr:uncharacterized protein CONPUDRAFT_165561 [Coniophora puteana RWD-64-598 SS2]EIW81410.1 hypothetical protein CONPUDRAFT_165561 [Coniophora puteana RWD-64-598 SS2]
MDMQRPFKLAIRRAQLRDLVDETVGHLDQGGDAPFFRLTTAIGVLRTRSVGWFVDGWNAINNPGLVQRAFSHCVVPDTAFNLSFESLTSRAARRALVELSHTDPAMWETISADISLTSAETVDDSPFTTSDSHELDDTATDPADLVHAILAAPDAATSLSTHLDVGHPEDLRSEIPEADEEDHEAEMGRDLFILVSTRFYAQFYVFLDIDKFSGSRCSKHYLTRDKRQSSVHTIPPS